MCLYAFGQSLAALPPLFQCHMQKVLNRSRKPGGEDKVDDLTVDESVDTALDTWSSNRL